LNPLAQALIHELFDERERELTLGGVPASELAREFGTPLFVYDAEILERRLALLRSALDDRVEVFFSVKANPNPEIIRCFVALGTGCEIASAAEYHRVRAAGCVPDRIVFAGPAKTEAELDHVVREGIGEVHIESEEEFATLGALAAARGTTVNVSVRVNPVAHAAGGAMQMGGKPAAFGIEEERLADVVSAIRATRNLRFRGIHMFAGTQILDANVLIRQWRHAVKIANDLVERGVPIETLDLGGGLGLPYFAHERPLEIARLASLSAELFGALPPKLERTRFLVEPGRFLVGPAGVYLARVQRVKVSRGTTFVLLDGGMHHHLAASGNLGQVIKRDYPIVNASRLSAPVSMAAVVSGPLCTPLDALGRKVELPETRAGDLLAVLQSGAYGLSASPVGFLSHPMPAEVLLRGGTPHRIRARGTFVQPLVPLP
jgi:diaminopimelate decarboxylase